MSDEKIERRQRQRDGRTTYVQIPRRQIELSECGTRAEEALNPTWSVVRVR